MSNNLAKYTTRMGSTPLRSPLHRPQHITAAVRVLPQPQQRCSQELQQPQPQLQVQPQQKLNCHQRQQMQQTLDRRGLLAALTVVAATTASSAPARAAAPAAAATSAGARPLEEYMKMEDAGKLKDQRALDNIRCVHVQAHVCVLLSAATPRPVLCASTGVTTCNCLRHASHRGPCCSRRGKYGIRRSLDGRVQLRRRSGVWVSVRLDMEVPGAILLRDNKTGAVYALETDSLPQVRGHLARTACAHGNSRAPHGSSRHHDLAHTHMSFVLWGHCHYAYVQTTTTGGPV